jgi:hypothetical protein
MKSVYFETSLKIITSILFGFSCGYVSYYFGFGSIPAMVILFIVSPILIGLIIEDHPYLISILLDSGAIIGLQYSAFQWRIDHNLASHLDNQTILIGNIVFFVIALLTSFLVFLTWTKQTKA